VKQLIFDKEMEIGKLCQEKCREIEKKHPFYYIDSTKWGIRWNYYMALWIRTLNSVKEAQGETVQI
jgi:hypothetical protein